MRCCYRAVHRIVFASHVQFRSRLACKASCRKTTLRIRTFGAARPRLPRAIATIVKAGPFSCDGASLTWDERQKIFEVTQVSVAVRERANTFGKRFLTLSGPISGIDLAHDMAKKYIKASQLVAPQLSDTPGSDQDWIPATNVQTTKFGKKGNQGGRKSNNCNSSCQPFQ